MNDIINKFDFKFWLFENFLWEIIFIPILFFIWYLISSIIISRYLLKNNRLGLGTGVKMYLADRFIQIWYSKVKIEYIKDIKYSPKKGFMYEYFYINVIDDKLIEKKLIKTERDPKTQKDIIVPITTIKNKLIIFFLKFYLIHFYFDKKDYYNNLTKK